MPVPQYPSSSSRQHDSRLAVLGHVNLMVDSLIMNTSAEDLRAIVRATLATTSPNTASAFTAAARHRFLQQGIATTIPTSSPHELFNTGADGSKPTPELRALLSRARSLYGSGLGLASLRLLSVVVRATSGHRWREGDLEHTFSDIDADISQALQSTREEIDSGRASDMTQARETLDELRAAIRESQRQVEGWGGIYPFERAAATLDFWKL